RVGPLPARRLASRHALPRSSDHHSSSSSSSLDSSPVHSSGLDASDQAHSGSSTRDVSPRLCYPPRRAPRHKSSSGDSPKRPLHSSSHFVRPSCKRCRSPVDSVPSSMPVMGSLAPTRADLLPPRKRLRDSYSSDASIEEDTEIDPIETRVDMEVGIGDGDDVKDHDEIDPRDVSNPISAPIVKDEIIEPAGEDSSNSSGTRDGIVRSFEDMPIDLDDAVRDFYHHMSEVHIDRIVRIETAQIRLEADQLIARGQRISMIERIDSLRLENLKVRAMLDIERDRVNRLRLYMYLSQEEFRQVRMDRDDTQGRLRRLESYVERHLEALVAHEGTRAANALETKNQSQDGSDGDSGNGNGGNGNGGNGNGRNENPNENVRGLIRWFEKMKTVFHIKNCPEKSQVKYATCTLLDSALTWWNLHKRTIRTEAAFAMSWRKLMKLMTEVYCPRNEIQKMETELWNLTVKNNNLTTYTQRF
ncbi:putative reverse transcriptase domain-containing protein, partial [Tanacetum coccineum]